MVPALLLSLLIHMKRMHAYIMESGLEVELIVGNSLIHMYAHCDDLDRAEAIFNNLRLW